MGTTKTLRLSILIVVLASFVGMGAAYASSDDARAVRAVSEQFYTALNAVFTGDVGPMKEVWSHQPTTTRRRSSAAEVDVN